MEVAQPPPSRLSLPTDSDGGPMNLILSADPLELGAHARDNLGWGRLTHPWTTKKEDS